MPLPGADSTREAASPCLGSADAKGRNAVGALQMWAVVCCLPRTFYYLPQQITPWAPGSGGEPGVRGSSGLRLVASVCQGFAGVSCASASITQSAGGTSSEKLFMSLIHDSNH